MPTSGMLRLANLQFLRSMLEMDSLLILRTTGTKWKLETMPFSRESAQTLHPYLSVGRVKPVKLYVFAPASLVMQIFPGRRIRNDLEIVELANFYDRYYEPFMEMRS